MATVAPTALSISDAAERLGTTAHTLRYYERAGLMLAPVDRAESSHRRYSEQDLEWCVLITKLRATGMPIRRIRDYAELVRSGVDTHADRLGLLESHRRDVLAHLEETRQNLAAIDRKIAYYRERTA